RSEIAEPRAPKLLRSCEVDIGPWSCPVPFPILLILRPDALGHKWKRRILPVLHVRLIGDAGELRGQIGIVLLTFYWKDPGDAEGLILFVQLSLIVRRIIGDADNVANFGMESIFGPSCQGNVLGAKA